ncbi:CRAL-TRIO domain-containing protein T23G5.2 isoform X1 [Folsomia candida]|uniref:CRAL-TRIO domain-containing protein n=1 Tax=Folsomia candida TaxID=158441 RepID=A0A226DSY8_FOLCA|nr:CRAL-TRIO domain-containing protein T23G5.2 isoform X1 [Folsomia candida]OXA48605.1 hypothetical protein Fcan01_16410 [Folsomia candida]
MGDTKLLYTVIIIVSLVGTTFSRENLSLTKAEKQKLDQFKDAVSKISFPAEWMQQELNLVRYLRARQWDVQRAKSMLQETVDWWEENNMKDIHNEDWTNIEKDFPLHTDGVDKLGQPAFVFAFAEWDLRGAAVQGRLNRVIRWFFKAFDDVHQKSIEYHKLGKTNGTQWNVIADMDKLSRQQHLCIQCLRFYTELALILESRYPGGSDKLFVVNSPSIFQIVLSLINPILSKSTLNSLKVIGANKEEWGKAVYSHFAKDQLPENLGGTKKYSSVWNEI